MNYVAIKNLLSTINSVLSLRSDSSPSAAQVYIPALSDVKFINLISMKEVSIDIEYLPVSL